MKRLADALASAAGREVRIRLLLEFGAHSQNQLSHDALKAFPQDLQRIAEVFDWPLERRELSAFGKPGKLHAKAAVILAGCNKVMTQEMGFSFTRASAAWMRRPTTVDFCSLLLFNMKPAVRVVGL